MIMDDNGGWFQMSLVSSPMVAATWENAGSANFLLSQHFLNRPMQVSFKIIRVFGHNSNILMGAKMKVLLMFENIEQRKSSVF